MRSPLIISAALLLLTAGCATLPETPTERALYEDLRRIVETRQRGGWTVDAVEIEDAAGVALPSTCQTLPEARADLDRWLSARIQASGGPAAQQYAQNGGDLDAVSETLTLERVQKLLQHTDARSTDDCPFWLEPDPDFEGLQTDRGRWVVLAESRGGGELLIRDGDSIGFGGGGGGRLLTAWGVGENTVFGFGAELGGGGAISEGDSGDQDLSATFSAALPVLLRFTNLSQLYDIELAATLFFTPERLITGPGARILFGFGLATERVGAFMPTALLQVGYSYHPPAFDQPSLHILHVGTRVGISWDP